MSEKSATKVEDLFADAEGEVSAGTLASFAAPDIGAAIQNGMGVNAEAFESSEIFAVVARVDDSGSIRFSGNAEAVRDGMNTLREELSKSQARDEIAMSIGQFNDEPDEPMCPFVSLSAVPVFDAQNYNPNGGTPLYDQVILGAGLLIAKWKEAEANGQQFRGVLLVVTDGAEEHSRASLAEVQQVMRDLVSKEIFLPIFMGIDDRGYTDFRKVAAEMGFPKDLVLTPGSTGREIREAFATVSRASVSASQSAASLSAVKQAGVGGFGAITN